MKKMDDWLNTDTNFYYAQPLHPLNGGPNENEIPKIPLTIHPGLISDSPTASPTKIVNLNESLIVDRDEDKRQLHLQSEKRRRQKIQNSYKYLESVVIPILGQSKISRAELLRKTADLVKDMHQKLNEQ